MTEKVASVRLTLNGSTYLGQLKSLGEETVKEAKRSESAWKQVGVAGFGAMKKSASDAFSAVKGTLKMVAGMGGALSLGTAVKGALDARSAFKGLAFDVEESSGETVDWTAKMREAQQVSSQWGISQTALANVFKDVQAETKDIDFATEAMKASGMVARATGGDVGLLGEIAGKMGSKFNVADGDIADGLSVVHSMSRQANIPLEEMVSVIDRIGSSGKSLGIEGIGGFERIMGLATIAKESTKGMRGALQATMQLMEQMGDPSHRKKMLMAFGVDTKGMDWERGLAAIIKKTGGKRDQLVKGFEGEQLKVVMSLAEVFKTSFEETTGNAKAKTAAGVEALRQHLTEAGTANVNASRMQERAAERMQSPQAQVEKAMQDLSIAFTRPEMMAGLLRLAKVAPDAANRLAKIVELAFDHPAMAAGIFAGMKLGIPLLQGAIGAGGKILAQHVGAAVTAAMLGKGGGVGSAVGGAAGFMGRAGFVAGAGVAGVAAGVVAAEEIDKNIVNPTIKTRNALKDATFAAEFNQDKGSLANLQARLAEAKKEKEFSWKDVASLGIRRAFVSSDKEIASGEKAVSDLQSSLAKRATPAANQVADSLVKATQALDRFGHKLDSLQPAGTPGGGGRGPMQPKPVQPGYSPR